MLGQIFTKKDVSCFLVQICTTFVHLISMQAFLDFLGCSYGEERFKNT